MITGGFQQKPWLGFATTTFPTKVGDHRLRMMQTVVYAVQMGSVLRQESTHLAGGCVDHPEVAFAFGHTRLVGDYHR